MSFWKELCLYFKDVLETKRKAKIELADDLEVVRVYEEWRDHKGRPHRNLGPAIIERDRITKTILREEWWKHGARHRENGPAIVDRTSRGVVYGHSWYMNGKERTPHVANEGMSSMAIDGADSTAPPSPS